jgi:amino acid transporter
MSMSLKQHTGNIFHFTSETIRSPIWRTWLIGRPLATADAPQQTIGKLVGLAVFASDALSSSAYATQEILMVLAMAGSGAFHFSIPIAIAITALMAIVTISYEQTIHAYPGGGGAYIVARDNLGELPAQAAGAALLTDYILTVAVSVSSGVAQITSAFPVLFPYRVEIAAGLVLLIMLVNLRGVKESGAVFAIPTYYFVIVMLLTVVVGLLRWATGSLGMVVAPPELEVPLTLQVVTPFLLLHALANGTSALTGIEAISNGITAFKEPRSRNAGITLIWMSSILATLFLGITLLANQIGAIPSELETVISQLARTVFGGQNILYLGVISGTALILILAANTAFADFPRLGALLAKDGFLPRQLNYRGSRLVYSHGITALAAIAILLIVIFQASVSRLIPLYAIGVFLSFTISQSGMARRWWKSGKLQTEEEIEEPGSVLRHDKAWMSKMVINGFGAVCTFIVMIVFAWTKFTEGAWIVIVLMPLLLSGFVAIHHHYKSLASQLSLENPKHRPYISHDRVLILISGVHQGTLAAIRFARSISEDITAVHIATDPQEAEKLQHKWEHYGEDIRLVILNSPYRLMIEPLLDYMERIEAIKKQNEITTIVVPRFMPKHWWANFLHMRTAETLRKVLLNRDDIVIVEVPYQIH